MSGVENIGAGSIGIGLPDGQSGPVVNPFDKTLVPATPQVTDDYKGPALTNSIFASLDYPQPNSGFSARMNAEPLTLQTQAHGLDITYENQINVWKDPNDPKSMGYNYSQDYFADLTAGVAGLNATQTKLAAATDWTATADWSNGQMQATMGEGLPFVYIKTLAGQTATVDMHAQPLDPTQGPVTPLTYTLSGLNGTFNGGQLKFNLPLDAGSNIAEGAQVRVSYDFNGDGKVDATQTYNWFGTDNTPGNENYSDAVGLQSSTGTMADMQNGTVTVQVWKRMGNGDMSLATDSANSYITTPFDNLTMSGGQAVANGTLYLQGGAQAGGVASTLTTAPAGTPGEDSTYVSPQTGVGGYSAPGTLWYNQGGVAGITINGRNYGLFGPTGSTWVNTPTGLQNSLDGKTYYSVAVLPDNSVSTLMDFRAHAYAFVNNTTSNYTVDQAAGNVSTTYTATTTPMETGPGLSNDPLMGLYSAQQKALDPSASLSSTSYVTAQGPMTLLSGGSSFTTNQKLQPLLPILPFVGTADQETQLQSMLHDQLNTYETTNNPLGGDSYWGSRQIAKYADLAMLAQQVGYGDAKTKFLTGVETQLEKWFTAGPNDTDGYGFYYDKTWDTLIGYPADFYSDTLLNDHMFHYGYLINAAATVAMLDPDWAKQSQYGGVVNQLIQDADDWQRSNTDPNSPSYPYLRNFDPYAGHSWAGGTGNNNEESVSEALNFASSTARWGAVTGQTDIENLGLYLQTTESNALEQYWFDVDHDVFPDGYKAPYVAQIYSDGAQLGTYFGTTSDWELGINITPMNGGSLFYADDPDSIRDNLAYLANVTGSAEPTDWKLGFWMYQALYDPAAALAAYNADPNWQAGAGEESRVYTLSWLDSLSAMGTLDTKVTADSPYAAVFLQEKTGKKSYVAFNPSGTDGTITFSDGKVINLAPDTVVTVDGTGAVNTINYLDKALPVRPVGIPWDLPSDSNQYPLTPMQVNGAVTLSVEQTTGYLWATISGAQGANGVTLALVRNGQRASQTIDNNIKITAIGTDANGQMWVLGTAPDGQTHYQYQLNTVTIGGYTELQIGTNNGALYNNRDYNTLEPLFNQDFNGDGIIQTGAVTPVNTSVVKPNAGWTLLQEAGSGALFAQKAGQNMIALVDSTGQALTLTRAGDTFGGIGATEDGTLMLLDKAGDGTLSGLSFDAKGKLTASSAYNASTLGTAESIFQQDLNGDGVIPPPPDQLVATSGSLELLKDPTTGYAVVQLEDGSRLTVTRDGWGAGVQLNHGSQLFAVGRDSKGQLRVLDGNPATPGQNATYWGWILDANGHYTDQTVYSGDTLNQAEAIFDKDLNGDGLINGVAPAGGVPKLTQVAQGGGDTLSVDSSTGNAYIAFGSAAPVQLTSGASGAVVQLPQGGSGSAAIATNAQGQTLLLIAPSASAASVWTVDATGKLGGVQTYDAATMFQAETLFNKDIDGDGTVGDNMKVINQNGGDTLYENTATGVAYVQVGTADPMMVTRDGWGDVQLNHNGSSLSAITTDAQGNIRVLDQTPGSNMRYAWILDATGKWSGETSYDASGLGQVETLFNQDLNGDGVIGQNAAPVTKSPSQMTLVDQNGSDALYVDPTTGTAYAQVNGQAPMMITRSGAGWGDVQLQRGDWSLGAIATDAQGQTRVLDEDPRSDSKYAWILDSAGNWSGQQSFDASTVGQAESLFGAGLNADGTIGKRTGSTVAPASTYPSS